MTESQLQDLVRLELGRNAAADGSCWWRNNCGVAEIKNYKVRFGVGNPGGADLIGLFRGRFVAVEIKTPDGRQSEDQFAFQRLVESKGGVYRIVRSVEDARALLEELRQSTRPEVSHG